jgi:hypothetical protein
VNDSDLCAIAVKHWPLPLTYTVRHGQSWAEAAKPAKLNAVLPMVQAIRAALGAAPLPPEGRMRERESR